MPLGDKEEPLFVRDSKAKNGYVLNHRNPTGLALIVLVLAGLLITALVVLA
ncbi:hypothetical protein [Streptomyces iconiensis]|uniref:Uncharacterized protein n=1 Tax=Streptomyces iconiensis TaxID=1384038 RepID=A0ABT6ZZA1_9ACTN|nr:hypothetical protein [Streptomyces iconiensis]MDJ1134402.1 hypothetical protein [Streptomyces iconiensis]